MSNKYYDEPAYSRYEKEKQRSKLLLGSGKMEMLNLAERHNITTSGKSDDEIWYRIWQALGENLDKGSNGGKQY